MLHGLELLQIKQLAFKQAEKVFSYRVVQTVSFPAHALPDSFCFEHTLIQLVLVLPALVGVENETCPIRYGCKSFVEHRCYHSQNRSLRDSIAHQISVVQIQNGRKIEFLAKQAELCHISNPLLVRSFRMEVSVQQIGSNPAHFSFVRTIFFDSDTANQSQLLHESLYCLVIQVYSVIMQCCGNTPVSIYTVSGVETNEIYSLMGHLNKNIRQRSGPCGSTPAEIYRLCLLKHVSRTLFHAAHPLQYNLGEKCRETEVPACSVKFTIPPETSWEIVVEDSEPFNHVALRGNGITWDVRYQDEFRPNPNRYALLATEEMYTIQSKGKFLDALKKATKGEKLNK